MTDRTVTKRLHPWGVKTSIALVSQDVSAEDNRERKLEGHLSRHYDEVISCIGDAESILIIGPGDAKRELKEHIVKNKLGDRVVGIETVDKMTDRQIAAKVREHFLKWNLPIGSVRKYEKICSKSNDLWLIEQPQETTTARLKFLLRRFQ